MFFPYWSSLCVCDTSLILIFKYSSEVNRASAVQTVQIQVSFPLMSLQIKASSLAAGLSALLLHVVKVLLLSFAEMKGKRIWSRALNRASETGADAQRCLVVNFVLLGVKSVFPELSLSLWGVRASCVTYWEIVGAVPAHQGVLVLQLQRVRLALTVAILVLKSEAAQLLVELQEPEVLFVCERCCVKRQRSEQVWIKSWCVSKDRRGINEGSEVFQQNASSWWLALVQRTFGEEVWAQR